MARRNSFARARGFLDFLPIPKWAALLAGVLSGLACLFFLGLLAFLFDLLVHQGRVPDWSDLSVVERDRFWASTTPEQKQRLLEVFGLDRADAERVLQSDQRHIVWQAAVNQLLQERVGGSAASLYRQRLNEPGGLGLLSLVVRARERWIGWPLGWLAQQAPGLWQSLGETQLGYLIRLAFLALVALLLLIGGELLLGVMAIRAASAAGARLRRTVYQHTFRRGSLTLRSQGPSEAVDIFTKEIEHVQDGLFAWLVSVGRLLQMSAVLLFAVAVSLWLAAALVLLAGLVAGFWRWASAAEQRRQQASIQQAAQQLALMQESLRLVRLVKCYLMDLFAQQRMDRQLVAFFKADGGRRQGEVLNRPLLAFQIGLAVIVWIGLAVALVLLDWQGSVEVLTAALAFLTLGLSAVDLRGRWPVLQQGRRMAEPLFEFLDQPADVAQELGADALPPLAQQIEFDNVSLREPGGTQLLLEDISLRIPAGQRIGLVGADERDKHALACLLPRFLDPTAGEVRLDENNLRWVTLESLRGQIGLVLRHSLVFNDTVLHNIGCGSDAKLPQITEAAKLAHAHQFIQKLPRGYETVIGDLGYALDVGEQFRIALARAILRQPSLLIIEEPAARDLDADTLALLDDTYSRILTGRTVLFLPHRLATLRLCDQLVLLQAGKIEAAGSHRDLLASNELYQHLHYLEFNPYDNAPGTLPL